MNNCSASGAWTITHAHMYVSTTTTEPHMISELLILLYWFLRTHDDYAEMGQIEFNYYMPTFASRYYYNSYTFLWTEAHRCMC